MNLVPIRNIKIFVDALDTIKGLSTGESYLEVDTETGNYFLRSSRDFFSSIGITTTHSALTGKGLLIGYRRGNLKDGFSYALLHHDGLYDKVEK